ANEEGIVRIYNTESRENPLKEWLAHENAVFDIAWVPGEPQLVTAAGDQMARLWDVKSGEVLGGFKGHVCSLKSVAFAPGEKAAVFCTGGRDGNIMVWDIRCSQKDGFYKQVKQISGAHNKSETNPSSKVKKRRSSMRGMAPSVVSSWVAGYSGLVLDSTRSNIMCNCTDDNVYMFSVCGIKTNPVAVFSGHQNSSFYIKSTISPDDQFLASGSSDNHTYIWKISDPQHPPMMLQGHSEEVTSVVWCPTDFTKIASCSDDHTIRIWRLRRETDGAQSPVGEANLVGWARPKSPTKTRQMPLGRAAVSPVNTQKTPSLGGLASPQLAVCAPNRAALPLPSSTTSPKSSVPLPAQSRVTATTPPHQVLRPCPLSPASGASLTERRAKRRLETGE
uniref:Denticleless E3 ubiquitin protein ligase homolog (Drosophila) n=1 Tax=Poecilia formosa TaxID=48698 RepID=A0A096M3C0_POEFO